MLPLLFNKLEKRKLTKKQIPYGKGITWPALIFGIIAAIMLAVGFLPVYIEMWKRRGRVVGFSECCTCPQPLVIDNFLLMVLPDWVFLSIDTLGALFSLFALGMNFFFFIVRVRKSLPIPAAQGTFDILGGILYIIV